MTSPAEIAELVKALRSVRASATVPPKDDTLFFVCQRAAAALEEVGKDAQRYRWLAMGFCGNSMDVHELILNAHKMTLEQFTAAIDAAISAEGK